MSNLAKEKIIVAVDAPNLESAESLWNSLRGRATWMKIGLQLFLAEGPEAVRRARAAGFRVFLDLKLHDIPNTARHAVRSAISIGAEMLTLHALGGPEMLRAAAAEARGADCLLLGVTLLTSMDAREAAAVGLERPVEEEVGRLAGVALEAGLGGVVASGRETGFLRERFGPSLRIVTPGVRPAGAPHHDQKRALTPSEALRAGSDFLVIGRPISAAPDPALAFDELARQLSSQ